MLVERIENLNSKMLEKFNDVDKVHQAILAQTTATNGKVAALTEWKIKADTIITMFKWIGGTIIVGVIVPLTYSWIKSKLKI